jgi:hypothetical protein
VHLVGFILRRTDIVIMVGIRPFLGGACGAYGVGERGAQGVGRET